jgi:septal ring-binding cell division protein DamX
VAIVGGVVLLAIVGGAAALNAVEDDAEKEVARTPVKGKTAPSGGKKAKGKPARRKATAKKAAPKRKAAKKPAPERKPAAKKRPAPASPAGLVQQGELYGWPRSLKAFTVVLISTEDRVSATNFARSAAKDKPAKIGVIRTDDFKTLPKGFYLVFAGSYRTPELADKAAARLNGRFQGAFPQLVER